MPDPAAFIGLVVMAVAIVLGTILLTLALSPEEYDQ